MHRFLTALLLMMWANPTWAVVPQNVLEQAMSGTTVPAMGLATIKGGRPQKVIVRGVRVIGSDQNARSKDRWLLNSTAKPMTAALMARLVEEGKLAWKQPLVEMLPDLKGKIRPEYETITLEEFLAHSAGLAHDVSDIPFMASFQTDQRPLPIQRLAYIIRALNEPPAAKVGTYSYSNTDYIIAATIADRVAGVPFETALRREIFAPLQMLTVAFGSNEDGALKGHNAGRVVAPADLNPMVFTASGVISMSLEDWAKFCADQLAGAKGHGKLLTMQSYAKMQTLIPGMPDAMPWLVLPSYKGFQGPALIYAGTDGSWFTLVALFPRLGSGALIAANAGDSMGGDKAVEAAMTRALRSLGIPAVRVSAHK